MSSYQQNGNPVQPMGPVETADPISMFRGFCRLSVSIRQLLQLLRSMVSVGLLTLTLVFAWLPQHELPSSFLFSGLIVIALLGGLLPHVFRHLPHSVATVVLIVIQWGFGFVEGMDQVWVYVLSDIPVLVLLPAILLAECLLWRSRSSMRPVVSSGRPLDLLSFGLVFVAVVWAMAELSNLGWQVWEDGEVGLVVAVSTAIIVASRDYVSLGSTLRESFGGRKIATALTVVSISALLATTFAVYLSIRNIDTQAQAPMGMAHELRENLRTLYPNWDLAEQDLDSLWQGQIPQILEAARRCSGDSETCLPVLRQLRDLFAGLNNGHTAVVLPADLGIPPIDTRKISNGTVVTWVDPEFTDETCRVSTGMEVISVDGESVEYAARNVPHWLISHARAEIQEYYAHQRLLWGLPGSNVTVVVRDYDGELCTTVLPRESAKELWITQNGEESDDIVEWEVLDEGVGYLYVTGFEGKTLGRRLGDALAGLSETSGLILDLRGNHGGDVALAEEFSGHFFVSEAHLGENCLPIIDGDLASQECEERRIDSIQPSYENRIAVLIDEESASVAEVVAYALCRVGTARCFGRTTSGETDFVVRTDVPGAWVSIASASFHPSVGSEIQGMGLAPDEEVQLRLEDVRNETDPVLDAAIRWLSEESPSASAEDSDPIRSEAG